MQTTPCTESRDLIGHLEAPRPGPVALDPALLRHVVGGTNEPDAPHGRWLTPLDADVGAAEAAPHGRW